MPLVFCRQCFNIKGSIFTEATLFKNHITLCFKALKCLFFCLSVTIFSIVFVTVYQLFSKSSVWGFHDFFRLAAAGGCSAQDLNPLHRTTMDAMNHELMCIHSFNRSLKSIKTSRLSGLPSREMSPV